MDRIQLLFIVQLALSLGAHWYRSHSKVAFDVTVEVPPQSASTGAPPPPPAAPFIQTSLGIEVVPASSERPVSMAELALETAMRGPRRCYGAACYVVDILRDKQQPRVFLVLLGLPASDIPRRFRPFVTNVSFVDVRTREVISMQQPYDIDTRTSGNHFSLQFSQNAVVFHKVTCKELIQWASQGVRAEATTFACDMPEDFEHYYDSDIDVFLTGINDNLPLTKTPFQLSSVTNSAGLFKEAVRNTVVAQKEDAITSSVCLIGVDYVSLQIREVLQYYLTVGFDHIYLGVPLWPTDPKFQLLQEMLSNYEIANKVNIIVSEYAVPYIQPQRWAGTRFSYARQGHKGSFVNSCILAARAAGDAYVYVGDQDELVTHKYGPQTDFKTAVTTVLTEHNLTLDTFCSLEFHANIGIFDQKNTGWRDTRSITEKLVATARSSDSVSKYGKSLHNCKRIVRVGMHIGANCEDLYRPGQPINKTRGNFLYSAGNDAQREVYGFRPDIEKMRILHLTDSYKRRSDGTSGHLTNYYQRDWAERVLEDMAQT